MKQRTVILAVFILALAACTAQPIHTWPTSPPRTQAGASYPGSSGSLQPTPQPTPKQSAAPSAAVQATATATAARALAALLPDKAGYQWQYTGFAEYASTLKLKSIVDQGGSRHWAVEGTVADMSGGEAQGGDFGIRIVYSVTADALSQQLESARAMDRTIPSLDLIRAPLKKGALWNQTVRDSTGKTVRLVCSITDVKQVNGRDVYFVLYQADGGEYYEKREITEGAGVTAYDKLYMFDTSREEIGYRVLAPQTHADIAGWDRWMPKLNFEYAYFGLAEYGHKGTLSRISASDQEVIYDFNGQFDDATGDNSRFAVRYRVDLVRGTVTEQVIANERNKPDINSKLHNLVILKFPLGAHARWNQTAKLDGKDVAVRAEVIEYDEGKGIVKIKYTAAGAPEYYNDTYVEIRTFEMGYGMTAFGNLLPGDIGITKEDAAFADRLQDALNQHMFGYSLNKTLIK